MEHCASNTAADKALKISAEDLQRCRAVLEERRVAVNRTWMGAHIANLSDILERLQEEKAKKDRHQEDGIIAGCAKQNQR